MPLGPLGNETPSLVAHVRLGEPRRSYNTALVRRKRLPRDWQSGYGRRRQPVSRRTGGAAMGCVADREPHLVAPLPVWAARMVLAVADLLEEAADAEPATEEDDRCNGNGHLRRIRRPLGLRPSKELRKTIFM
jgi:hypothetical protein